MNALVPCAVLVDTRNVHGTGKTIFGSGRRPMAKGIHLALEAFGLEPVEIYAGVATEPSKKSPSQKVQQMVASNAAYAQRLEADGVTVLRGLLAEQGGKVNEKQVDVRLAVQVADLVDRISKASYEQVVVFSEDMDLIPAYEYAARRGVEVYAAAANTVHVRPQQRKWMLLTENAVSDVIGERHYADTDSIRDYQATVAVASRPLEPVNWKSFGFQKAGTVTLYSNRSIDATYESAAPLQRNQRLSLVPDKVIMKGRFPTLSLAASSLRTSALPGFESAIVEAWVDPTQLRVRLNGGGTRNLTVSPGAALVGDDVVVFRDPQHPNASLQYVGLNGRWSAPPGWTAPKTAVLTVTDAHRERNRLQAVTQAGDSVALAAKWLRHATKGSRVLAAVTGLDVKTGLPEAMPLSCCLP